MAIFAIASGLAWAASSPSSASTDAILHAAQTAQAASDRGNLGASQRRVLAAELNRAVIQQIATNPGLVRPVIQSAVFAAPDFKSDLVTETSRAFPGFRSQIKAAADNPRAPAATSPIVRVATTDAMEMGEKETTRRAAPKSMDDSSSYWIAEVSIGVTKNDVGAFGRQKEDGQNINAELRFQPFDWEPWRWIFSPMPHLGIHVNTAGDTNQLYFGGTWSFDIIWGFYAAGSLGFSLHDGKTEAADGTRKELGLSILFRESLELGFRITDHHALSVILDHISNASIAENNEGLDTFGFRYTYRL